MVRLVKAFAREESGATSIEYGMIAVLISIAILVALTSMSGSLLDLYNLIAGSL